jgi:ketosteroid isomerase-like protein
MTTTTSDETAILDVLTEHQAALRAGDAERVIGLFGPGAARYDLAPPLRRPNLPTDEAAAGLRAWMATFDGPVEVAFRDPTVLVDGGLAVVHGLTSMTATPVGEPEPFVLWFRSTYALRCHDGVWAIVHQHESVPFHMDGSFRAATELTPV